MRILAHWIIGRRPRRTFVRLVFTVAALWLTGTYVIRPVYTDGTSMEPTVRDRSFHLVNLQAYRRHPPQAGDIVMIREGVSRFYLKRVLALPGDTVAFERGRLYRNGTEIPEPYVQFFSGQWNTRLVTLSNEFFVAGDNRGMSQDMHMFGRVKKEDIVGKLLW